MKLKISKTLSDLLLSAKPEYKIPYILELLSKEDLTKFKLEILDRFGQYSFKDKITNLDETIALRELCIEHKIATLSKRGNKLAITISQNGKWNIDALLEIAKQNKNAEIALFAKSSCLSYQSSILSCVTTETTPL